MNKIIKFKAWHIEKKLMREVWSLFGLGLPLLPNDAGRVVHVLSGNNDKPIWQWSFDEIELIEWTGLIDKNDTPIYEKDILRINHSQECYIVEHIESEARFVLRKIGHNIESCYKFFQHNMNMFEIVANAFENPTMLDYPDPIANGSKRDDKTGG